MKRKELAVVNLLLAALVIVFGGLAFKLSVNQSQVLSSSTENAVQAQQKENGACSKEAALTIPSTNDPNLQRLSAYQDICSSFVTDRLMIFTGFSQDISSATTNAAQMAHKLKLFKQAGVVPIVVAEPYISDQAMSYKRYLAGEYDVAMNYYFQQLKAAGISDAMMGTWVPFPESNTPSWNNVGTEPHDFALCVNKYLKLLKRYFPGAKGSILLNATTYDPTDVNWDNGDYISLSPYVDALDNKLVTSVGIQGFPWMTNAQQAKRTIFKAQEFLQPDLAIGMAQVLRTRDIWINTGAFASKYTNDPTKTVHLSIAERKALLDDILQVAVNIRDYQENQYRVSINLFAEDKSRTTEATDWSYFQSKESEATLKDFLMNVENAGIPLSISDKTVR